jgi:hypothetical protein
MAHPWVGRPSAPLSSVIIRRRDKVGDCVAGYERTFRRPNSGIANGYQESTKRVRETWRRRGTRFVSLPLAVLRTGGCQRREWIEAPGGRLRMVADFGDQTVIVGQTCAGQARLGSWKPQVSASDSAWSFVLSPPSDT